MKNKIIVCILIVVMFFIGLNTADAALLSVQKILNNVFDSVNNALTVILDPDSNITIGGKTIFTPSNQVISGVGDTVNSDATFYRLSAAGALVMTSTPTVTAGSDGQFLILEGTSDSNTITLQDDSNLSGSDLFLSGNVDMVLGVGDTLTLLYNTTVSGWCEQSRSVN